MTAKGEEGKVPLTIRLSGDLARRLQQAAAARNRPAAEVVIELLARHLPHLEEGGPQKKKIPYT